LLPSLTGEFMMKIWDGNAFREVSDKVGRQLVKEDKAQEIDQVLRDGEMYKFRAEFTGYKTREMRAEKTPTKKTKAKK